MLPVSFAAIIFTLGLSAFLSTSFHSFKDYNHQISDFTNWQETSLASAKRVSLESSKLLSEIKTQLNSCLEEYSSIEAKEKRASFQCETEFDTSFEEFKTSLKKNYQNQLNSTIKYGLNPNDTGITYESVDYELYYSDKLPSAFKAGDDLYNSTLVKESNLKHQININDFDYYIDSGKLNIKDELLKSILGKDNFDIVSRNPSQFNVNLSTNDLLEEKKLPNAIKLTVNFHRRQSMSLRGEAEAISNEEDKVLSHKLLSAGQLKLQGLNVSVKDPDDGTVISDCLRCNCPLMPRCPDPEPPVDGYRHQITFGQFHNVSGRGIYFDNSQPASAQNQINIVNTNQNRFTSVYPGAGNFLNINIGTLPRASSVLINNRNQSRVNFSNVDFATVTFETNPPPGRTLNITESSNLSVDIVPRARKRYMTAQKDFHINGKLIPKGTILVGTLKPGSVDNNVKFSDLSNIRAYSASTGALMQIFKPGDQRKSDCGGSGACMQVNEFRSGGVSNLPGANVLTSFSTAQLFPGKNFAEVNRLFVNIQQDLEVNSNMGIYNANFDWQRDILRDDLNDQQKTLITETLEKYDIRNSNQRSQLIKDLGVGYVRTGDSFIDKFQAELENSFVEFVDIKGRSLRDPGRIPKKKIKEDRDRFVGLRNIYQDLMKANITQRQADNRIFALIDRRFLYTPPPPKAPVAPSHPGQAPIKPVCKKPKSNACKKKRNKYKKAKTVYEKKLKKYNKDLAKYRVAHAQYLKDIERHKNLYG